MLLRIGGIETWIRSRVGLLSFVAQRGSHRLTRLVSQRTIAASTPPATLDRSRMPSGTTVPQAPGRGKSNLRGGGVDAPPPGPVRLPAQPERLRGTAGA